VTAARDTAGPPATDRLMSIDASGYRYWSGRGGVVLVNDPLETVREVAEEYDIRWLILERDDTVPAAESILVRHQRPPWVGPPVLETEDVGVYPVCTDASDPRCASAVRR
jgi:hypothetical protein